MPAVDRDGQPIRIGDTVRSHYAAPWIGVVREIVRRVEKYPYRYVHHWVTAEIIRDRHGNPPRKPSLRRLDSTWFRVIRED